MDDADIDAQIQKELDALSLSSLDLEDETSIENDNEEVSVVVTSEKESDATLLFLEKSAQRNKVAENILKEAEDLLSESKRVVKFHNHTDSLFPAEGDENVVGVDYFGAILLPDGKELVSAKTVTEIEEENNAKLQELEDRLRLDEEKENFIFERERISQEEKMSCWIDKESKIQENLKIMLDKAEYWETTYNQVAQDEFTKKENDLEEEYLESQRRIEEMQEEQGRILKDLLREKEELDRKRKDDAATRIQTLFRGYVVRRKHGGEVQEKLARAKEERRQERIAAMEKKRAEDIAKSKMEKEKLEKEKKSFLVQHKEQDNRDVKKLEETLEERQNSNSVYEEEKNIKPQKSQTEDLLRQGSTNSEAKLFQNETVTNFCCANNESRPSEFASLSQTEGQPYNVASHLSTASRNDEDSSSNESSPATQTDAKQMYTNSQASEDDGSSTADCAGHSQRESVAISNSSSLSDESSGDHKTLSKIEEEDSGKVVENPSFDTQNDDDDVGKPDAPEVEKSEFHQENHKNDIESPAYENPIPVKEKDVSEGGQKVQVKDSRGDEDNRTKNAEDPVVAVASEKMLKPDFETEVSAESPLSHEILEKNLEKEVIFHDTSHQVDLTKDEEEKTESDIYLAVSNIIAQDKYEGQAEVVLTTDAILSHTEADQNITESFNHKQHSVGGANESSSFVGEAEVNGLPKENLGSEIVASQANLVKSQSNTCFHPTEVTNACRNEKNTIQNGNPSVLDVDINEPRSKISTSDNNLSQSVDEENSTMHESKEILPEPTKEENVDEKTLKKPFQKKDVYLVGQDMGEKVNLSPHKPEQSKNTNSSLAISSSRESEVLERSKHQENDPGEAHINLTSSKKLKPSAELPYSAKLQERRLSWLQNHSMKQRIESNSPPSLKKRRRLVRISSAAKRLHPFSYEEILSGAYVSPDCRTDEAVSAVELSECVALTGIHGGRNLTSLANCQKLTFLSLQNCGLVSLENLQPCPCLKYVDVSHNSINMICCVGMKQLEYLDASHNPLTSIHGLEGCRNLLFLDLSFNNITKLSGLEDAVNLSHLRLTDNQLIGISGLNPCRNLVYLDVSENHLINLESLDDCGLLLSVAASGNNLETLGEKFLNNAVILTKLNVSRNNLSSLGFSEDSWLPCLTELNCSVNRIGSDSKVAIPELSVASPFFSYLNLSKNLVTSVEELSALSECVCLSKVDVTDNPLSPSNEEETSFLRHMPEVITKNEKNDPKFTENPSFDLFAEKFCPLHLFGKGFLNLMNKTSDCDILKVVSKQLDDLQLEVKKHSLEVHRSVVRWMGRNDEKLAQRREIYPLRIMFEHCEHLKKINEMAAYFRNIHESKGLVYSDDVKISSGGCDLPASDAFATPLTAETPDENLSQSLSELNSEKSRDKAPVQISSQMGAETLIADSLRAQPTFNKEKKQPVKENSSKTVVKPTTIYEKLKLREKSEILKDHAARKIQTFWRGYCVRKRHRCIKNARSDAAITIQALWRGHRTRVKIKRAMDMLKESEIATAKQDELEDIDLDNFEFDEKSFDEQWAYKVAGLDEMYPGRNKTEMEQTTPFLNHYASNFGDNLNETRKTESTTLFNSKPPLPPIPSRSSTPLDTHLALTEVHSQENSIADSNRTKKSIKQEILSNEWGIKSSSTADLMMRRARRMKGGKKKIQTADDKLHRFQEKVSTFQHSDLALAKRHNPTNRVDYFKAHEQENTQKNKLPSEEDERRRQYTYEWLHTQVGANYDHQISPPRKGARPHPPDTHRTRSSGFLPAIPRSPSLVGTQDLEVVSVNSSSLYMERSKERLRDIARRHNPSYGQQR